MKRSKSGQNFITKAERSVDKVERSLDDFDEKLDIRMSAVESKIDGRAEAFERKVEAFESRVESRVEALDRRIEGGVEAFERKVEAFGRRLDAFDKALDARVAAWERILGGDDGPGVILEALGVKKYFTHKGKRPAVRAVDGVDFLIPRGETLGVVGESGCGKSTAARVVIGLTPATGGTILLGGEPVRVRDREKQREIRRRTGIVFQDPYGSLDPRMTVANIVSEPLRAHGLAESKTDMLLKSLAMLESCGMRADDLFKFPHQFSGGQRQRICIARALIAGPDLVVCDEAVSALDVSVQAQIINLLCDLRQERGLTYLFISHDLEVVRFIADRIAVMYLGKVVEMAKKDDLFRNPRHPYTVKLLESAPVFGKKRVYDNDLSPQGGAESNRESVDEPEMLAGVAALHDGCSFHARCPKARDECLACEPELTIVAPGHSVACNLYM